MRMLQRICLAIGIAGLIAVVAGIISGATHLWQPAAVVAAAGLAIGVAAVPALRTYQFTCWIIASVVAAMLYPAYFQQLGPVNLRDKTLILLIMQLVMFGMGTQMRLHDFLGVVRMPYPVLIGVALQFTIMPLVGFAIAKLLGFPPEVAAGIVLIGSCSSGLASNVMTYIAQANLPLSITLTSITTLLAPLATPLWMKLLAGRMIEVEFLTMMVEIVKLVMVPISAAMLDDYLEHASPRGRKVVLISACAAAVALVLSVVGGWTYLLGYTDARTPAVLDLARYLLGAIVAGVAYHGLKRLYPAILRLMPVLSMLGIVYVTSITAAAGRDRLLVIGPLLLVAVILHNSTGYLLGYWLSRAFRLDEQSARTVALEVGLQNGGMATTIAASLNQLATLGLASAVFSPWMNFSGSILANYWRRRPVKVRREQ